jgi:dCMP deaminase
MNTQFCNIIKAIVSVGHRPSWDEYFMTMACLTSLRSNCIRRKVGSIVVKDNKVLSMGYNGTPIGMVNCCDGGCIRCNKLDVEPGTGLDMCMCLHAEENAIMYVGKHKLQGSTIYCTLIPCIGCLKKLIQCGVKRIVHKDDYNDQLDQICTTLCQQNNIIINKIEIE